MNKVYTFYNSMWQLFWKADGGGNDSDAEAEQLVILSWHAPISPLYIPSKRTKIQKDKKDKSWHATIPPLYIPSLFVSGTGTLLCYISLLTG